MDGRNCRSDATPPPPRTYWEAPRAAFRLLGCLAGLLAAASLAAPWRAARGAVDEPCVAETADEPLFASALRRSREQAGERIALAGLATLDERQLRRWLGAGREDGGGDPGELLRLLAESGLFSAVDLAPGEGPLLALLVEQPRITGAQVSGLVESSVPGLLGQLLGSDPPSALGGGAEEANALGFEVWRKRMDEAAERACPVRSPPPDWFARTVGGRILPGLVRGGLGAARLRALRWLRLRGYPAAQVSLALDGRGALLVEADEGSVATLDVRGVSPALRPAVLRALGLRGGDVLSGPALRRAAARLHNRFPFVALDARDPAAVRGGRGEGLEETRPLAERLRAGRLDLGDLYFAWRYQDAGPAAEPLPQRGPGAAPGAVTWEGPGHALLWLRAEHVTAELDWSQLVRHTPATGFAPALSLAVHLWDGEDRGHLALDGLAAVNTQRGARAVRSGASFFERLSAAEQVDFLAGARVSVPRLRLAELGAQLYALTDTQDGWRMDDLNSYVHSALLGQPDRDYLRRAGVTALATFLFDERLVLGAELRRERFDPLPTAPVWSLRSGVEPPPAAQVSAAALRSLLVRFEWSTEPSSILRLGGGARHAALPLSAPLPTEGFALRTLATFELGDGAAGGAGPLGYRKVSSDSRLQLAPLAGFTLGLRLRAALAGGVLPLQESEALGGWSALRGYSFKELRGDGSLLATVDVRWRFVGLFADAGSVQMAPGWTGPRVGAGAFLSLRHLGRIEVAWRLDGRGSAAPSARAQLAWEQ